MGTLKASTAYLSWKEETDYNETPTAEAQTEVFGLLRDKIPLPDPKRAYEIYRVAGSASRVPTGVDRNEIVFEGSIPFTLQHGKALVFGLGKSVKTGTSPPFTHTIQTADELPSFVVEATIGDGTTNYLRYYTGVKVNRMTLEGTEKGVIKATLDVLAAKGYKSTNTPSTVVPLDIKPYQFHQTSTNLTLWGTPFARVKNWSLTVDNHLEQSWYWQNENADYPYELDENEQTVEMKATIVPTSLDIFDHIGAETEFDIDFKISRGTSDSIEIKNAAGYTCFMPEAPHPIPEKGKMEVDVLIKMRSLEIIVVDAISAYPNETGP